MTRRALSPAARAELHTALSTRGDGAALAFAEAVALQYVRPLGRAPGPAERQERLDREAGRRIARLVTSAAGLRNGVGSVGREPAPASAAELRADAELLAAVFQNIDLLYRDGYPHADSVADLVMRALALACSTDE